MAFPDTSKYIVIGAGIHGLSAAYHLALELKDRNKGSGKDILVIDKGGIASGASGIACGVIRNNYYQPAMRELMAHSVDVWESDPETYSYHPVGYMQISPERMHDDVANIAREQKAIGYESTFIEGERDSRNYMLSLFDDWQAQGITSVLHEKRGGYANNSKTVYGLAGKVEALDVRIMTGVEVIGFTGANGGGAIRSVETNKGSIACDYVIVGAGPWIKSIWEMLDLEKKITIVDTDGAARTGVPMWEYWSLQEGTLGIDPETQKTNDGKMPPVIHVDSDAPLYSDEGNLITDEMWGIYYKPDFHFGGIQGGALPLKVETDPNEVAVDPYGPASPEFIVGPEFAHLWCSGLAHCQKRFEAKEDFFKKEPSGGIGAFSPDSFPIFDVVRQNCYLIADSNHGFKMLGVGKLVAEEICGARSALLEPFRFSRFGTGKLHPSSNSPFPWS
jgi:hypothetical protein